MKSKTVFLPFSIITILVLSLLVAADTYACSCTPDANRSLCQLGDQANAGDDVSFLAVVELTDSIMIGYETIYSVEVVELLAGVLPPDDLTLVQYGEVSCSQYEYIEIGARGVLVGNPVDGAMFPDFCTLGRSFFKLSQDTVFLRLNLRNPGPDGTPYTLTDFRTGDCVNFSDSEEVATADEAFSLSYDWQSAELDVIVLDPSIRSESLALSIYTSSGQHLLETTPSGPIDVSSFPPGMYAILLRNEQKAWSKAFVKPN